MLYSTFTAFLGFSVNEDEFKVMGLSAYGRPTMTDRVKRVIRRTADGAFALVPEYFEFQTSARRSYSSRFIELFGEARSPLEPIDLDSDRGRHYADIAASVQRVLEDTLIDLARALHRDTGLPDLCWGGGVALNGVANGRILTESGFERMFVPPAPGDAGCALGAALYADRIYFGNADRELPDHPFWGPAVDPDDLARVAREDAQTVEDLDDELVIERVADELTAGRIVGWMDGRCEFGPRALGHRSILAAPHSVRMRDRLNRDIKDREDFRPFAPVVPIEAADDYFELPPGGARLGRFMSGVFPVRPAWRGALAAITHVDGSARVQVLERSMAPRLHALLQAYGQRTGIPILLNTSFNVAGEPIVTTALEGYSTFRRCGLDLLVAGPTVVSKHAAQPAAVREEAAWSSRESAESGAA
jgi:carbamoyltransferase